jgi:hypothetical protein
LHPTDAGLGLQINDQGFSWLGKGSRPLWTARTKPYLYCVSRAAESDVFIGTDGNGGRLLAFAWTRNAMLCSARGNTALSTEPDKTGVASPLLICDSGTAMLRESRRADGE